MTEEEKKGPSLGGPKLGGPALGEPKGPSLGASPSSGPSLGGPQPPSGSSIRGPSLGGPSSSGPSLGSTTAPSSAPATVQPIATVRIKKREKKKKKKSVVPSLLLKRWGILMRRVNLSLQNMLGYEMKTKVTLTPFNKLLQELVAIFMDGQISYCNEMIEQIAEKKDPLSQLENSASDLVFRRLIEIISEERDRMLEEGPKILDIIEEDLKRFKDARLEPRMCFWILILNGLQLQEIHEKTEDELDIILDVLLRTNNPIKQSLAVYIHFCKHLIEVIQPYPIDTSRMNLIISQKSTGYSMAPWIKYRYGTAMQHHMEYERFLTYFARSFGTVSGKAPDFEGGPKDGYREWIDRTLVALHKDLKGSPYIEAHKRGDTLEGQLAGLISAVKQEIASIEYDIDGKIINFPYGVTGIPSFLEWLLETGINRFETTNVASHGEVRLELDMFDFIQGTIAWTNEYGENLVYNWVEMEEEEEVQED